MHVVVAASGAAGGEAGVDRAGGAGKVLLDEVDGQRVDGRRRRRVAAAALADGPRGVHRQVHRQVHRGRGRGDARRRGGPGGLGIPGPPIAAPAGKEVHVLGHGRRGAGAARDAAEHSRVHDAAPRPREPADEPSRVHHVAAFLGQRRHRGRLARARRHNAERVAAHLHKKGGTVLLLFSETRFNRRREGDSRHTAFLRRHRTPACQTALARLALCEM